MRTSAPMIPAFSAVSLSLAAAALLLFQVSPCLGQPPQQAPPSSSGQSGNPYSGGSDGSSGYEESDGSSGYDEMESGYEDMESGYDDMESEYGGGSRGRSSRAPATAGDAMMQSYGSAMNSVLRSVDLAALLAPTNDIPAVDAGPILTVDAEHAYQGGNYPLALELYFAHIVSEYDHARANLQSVAYSRLLRRPLWQTRFGVSFAVRGAVDADPQPIEEGKTKVNRVAAAGGRGDQQYDSGDDGSSGRVDEPYEPEMEMEMEMEMDMNSGRDGESGLGPSMSRKPAQPQLAMLSPEAIEEMDKFLGLVAKIVAEEFDARYRQGDYGSALVNVMPPAPVDPKKRNNDDDVIATPTRPISQEMMDMLADSPEPRPLWQPGIQYFGETESASAIKEAQRENVDLIFHFDVFLKEGRQGNVQNVSRVRLLHVGSGKSLGVSKGMDSAEAVRMAQTKGITEREYVTEQLANLFGVMDRNVKAIPMPALTADVAKRRLGSLMSGSTVKRLRTLAEVRLYQAQELITAEEAENAFYIIGGDDALLFLHGPVDQRMEIVRKWAIKAVPPYEG